MTESVCDHLVHHRPESLAGHEICQKIDKIAIVVDDENDLLVVFTHLCYAQQDLSRQVGGPSTLQELAGIMTVFDLSPFQ